MPPTLRDIAAKLNLSPSLVSGVLNDRPGVWASDETRGRVRHAARELGYRPHSAARALRSGKTRTVALVYVRLKEPHRTAYSSVIEAMADFLYAHGYQLMVQPLGNQGEVLSHLSELARTRLCDVAVLWGEEAELEEQGLLLERLGIPFVVKGHHEERRPHWPQVEFDHEAMMARVVRLLAGRGRERIAYIGYGGGQVYVTRLIEGFRQAMRSVTGEAVREDWVARIDAYPEGVEACMARWMALPEDARPTAIALGAGAAAWEAIEIALARRGQRIGYGPSDVAVAGTSNIDVRLLFGEGHVYRGLDFFDLARAMCERLVLPLMRGEALEEPVLHVCPALHPTKGLHLLEQGIVRFP